jgi:hypothetical protein
VLLLVDLARPKQVVHLLVVLQTSGDGSVSESAQMTASGGRDTHDLKVRALKLVRPALIAESGRRRKDVVDGSRDHSDALGRLRAAWVSTWGLKVVGK